MGLTFRGSDHAPCFSALQSVSSLMLVWASGMGYTRAGMGLGYGLHSCWYGAIYTLMLGMGLGYGLARPRVWASTACSYQHQCGQLVSHAATATAAARIHTSPPTLNPPSPLPLLPQGFTLHLPHSILPLHFR